jgi:prepilin-type N-terminal cleavage/methylation domain-containing protein
MKRHGQRSERGFTLMELLVTLSVTTIGLIGLMGLHLSIARSNDDAARSAEAQAIATQELESLRAQLIPDMMTTLAGTATALPPVTNTTLGTVTGRSGMTYRRVVKVTAPSTSSNLWLVRVEVSWTEDGAVAGANGGQLDHTLAVEVLRTVQEAL